MKLYLISQTENYGYDTYDSAVVCAKSAKDARHMYPATGEIMNPEKWNDGLGSWASSPDKVESKYLGPAAKGIKQGIICSSFNAG